MRGLPYDVKALVEKARETALLAVETYNRPTASFRSGAYVVLMIIAWTSLFHAMFLRKGIKPFSQVIPRSSSAPVAKAAGGAFKAIKQYVDTFRSSLSADVQNDLAYSFKVFLVPKIGNHASKDAIAVEWIKYDPSKPEEMRNYENIIAKRKATAKSVECRSATA